ncbi:hypothetical protein JKG47_08975 [Acidithiobacillus sp. MC6.1]|nr:hypothetical protein [Acidithiobacillus sp. MC6.1]
MFDAAFDASTTWAIVRDLPMPVVSWCRVERGGGGILSPLTFATSI